MLLCRLLSCLLFFCLGGNELRAQTFSFAAKDAVKVPEAPLAQIRRYIEVHDGIPQARIGKSYPYFPVFNVLHPHERQFRDGLYYFLWGSHDSGRLVIYQQGTLTFLANESTPSILADYLAYLKRHPLPETTQVAYLSAIAAFMKFRYEDQRMLIKSGAVQELK